MSEQFKENMAIRVRKNGRMFCAALTDPEDGDTYIDDTLHYKMSVEHRVIVSEEAKQHAKTAEWWWRGAVPKNIKIADHYNE